MLPEEEKDPNYDFYGNPIFETNQDLMLTKYSVPSTHRSERDVRIDAEAQPTERKKIGELVFISNYAHSKLAQAGKMLALIAFNNMSSS